MSVKISIVELLMASQLTSHPSLESVSSSTAQHFVDSDDVERVNSHSHVECVFSHILNHVLVSTDSGSLQSLTWNNSCLFSTFPTTFLM